MNQTFIIATTLLLIAAGLWFIHKARPPGFQWLANAITVVNIFADGRANYLADNAFTARYLVAKRGTDANHIDICTATDIPLGIVPDMNPSAGDLTYPLPCNLFTGAGNETQRAVASGAIALDAFVVPDAGGKVKTATGLATGTYYVIGRALTAAAANNDLIHIAPLFYKDRVP